MKLQLVDFQIDKRYFKRKDLLVHQVFGLDGDFIHLPDIILPGQEIWTFSPPVNLFIRLHLLRVA